MNVLVLTATIAPIKNMPGVIRSDPAVRLNDYHLALDYYLRFLNKEIDYIIFAENSNYNIQSLRDLVSLNKYDDKVYFLSFDGLKYPAEYGKCYGEMSLLDIVMANDIIDFFDENTLFWKVTGRYRLLNIRKMLNTSPKADLYMDLRARAGWADLRVISWNKKGYINILQNISNLVREDTNAFHPGEEAAYRIIKQRIQAQFDVVACTSFVTEPLIDGVRAFDGKNWMLGKELLVYFVRNIQRRILGRIIR